MSGFRDVTGRDKVLLVPAGGAAMRRRILRVLTILFFSSAAGGAAQETAVDLELVLAVNVLVSMKKDEHTLQRYGYVAVCRHPQVINTIGLGCLGCIAVAYVEWAGPDFQVVTVP